MHGNNPLISEDMFQSLQWMPETADSIKSCICCFAVYVHGHDGV
jgi:hypothetical protein